MSAVEPTPARRQLLDPTILRRELSDAVAQEIRATARGISVEDRSLLVAVVADLAWLQAQASAGVDVAAEMPHVEAQRANLTAAAQAVLASAMERVARQIVGVIAAAAGGALSAALGTR